MCVYAMQHRFEGKANNYGGVEGWGGGGQVVYKVLGVGLVHAMHCERVKNTGHHWLQEEFGSCFCFVVHACARACIMRVARAMQQHKRALRERCGMPAVCATLT